MEEILQDAQGLCRAGTKCTERKVSIVAKEQNTKVIDAILSSSGSDASASKSRARRSRRVKGFQKSGASNGSLPELVMSAADVAALEEKTEKTSGSAPEKRTRRPRTAKNAAPANAASAPASGSAAPEEKKPERRRTRRPAARTSAKSVEAEKEEIQRSIQNETLTPEASYDLVTPPPRPRRRRNYAKTTPDGKKPTLKIIPLGGLNEIGKNLTVYEYGKDILIVDCGMGFPDSDMLGVDLVIPDFTYLEKNRDKIRGMVITHGHEDHIGSVPYFLKKFGTDIPIYGARLTLGLIDGKLKEHGLAGKAKLNSFMPGDVIKLGAFTVEAIHVNHSIPDSMAFAITTPAGVVVHTGDFKVDYTPIEGRMIDLARFAELGKQGVLALLSESTNAERPGYTESERNVGRTLSALFQQAGDRRIIIATFSSNIHRIQQIVNLAAEHGRKVAVSGRSMVNVVTTAIELGYLSVPKDILIDADNIGRYTADRLVIITTGSQGEPMSALSRMAAGEHRKIQVTPNDFIIISANPIPGNEKHVTRVINDLLKLGAEVISKSMYEVHVSGHACQNELKLMLSLVKPKFFIPIHGEYQHLAEHAKLAQDIGIAPSNILLTDIGQVIELTPDSMQMTGTVEAGRVFVDGYGVGDVGSIVLRDRKHLAQDGLIIVVVTIENESGAVIAGPDIVSRGFVYVRESEELMETARLLVKDTLDDCQERGVREWSAIKLRIKDSLSSFIYKKTKRDPMILPIIMEI